jgi:hypothetical protein
MTKHYLPDPVMAFDISEDILNRGRRDVVRNALTRRCRLQFSRFFPKCVTLFFIMFVFGGGTLLGFTLTPMPTDYAGYSINEDGEMVIYYPDSVYFLSPSVSLKKVAIKDRNLTIGGNRQCTASIDNIKMFLESLYKKNNGSIDHFFKDRINEQMMTYNIPYRGNGIKIQTCYNTSTYTNSSVDVTTPTITMILSSTYDEPTSTTLPQSTT